MHRRKHTAVKGDPRTVTIRCKFPTMNTRDMLMRITRTRTRRSEWPKFECAVLADEPEVRGVAGLRARWLIHDLDDAPDSSSPSETAKATLRHSSEIRNVIGG